MGMAEVKRDNSYVVSCVVDPKSDYSTDSAIADKLLKFFSHLSSHANGWFDAGWYAKTRGEQRLYVDTGSVQDLAETAARSLIPDPITDPLFSSPAEYGRTIQLCSTGSSGIEFQLVAGNSLDSLWIANMQRVGMGIATYGDGESGSAVLDELIGMEFLRAAVLSLDLSFGTLISESSLDQKSEQGVYIPVGDEFFVSSELVASYPKSGHWNPAGAVHIDGGVLVSVSSEDEHRAVEEWLGAAIG